MQICGVSILRITDKQVHQALRLYSEQVRRQEKKAEQPPVDKANADMEIGHSVSLSPQSQEFLAAMHALRQLPEVDAARVADLQQQIKGGAYQVDSRRLARKMLDRLM